MIDQSFIDSQKKVIEEKITELESDIRAKSKYADSGSSTEDNIQDFEQFEESQAMTKNDQRDLVMLKAAAARIEEGTYGKCKRCDEQIERSRLEMYPEADFCATHAKK